MKMRFFFYSSPLEFSTIYYLCSVFCYLITIHKRKFSMTNSLGFPAIYHKFKQKYFKENKMWRKKNWIKHQNILLNWHQNIRFISIISMWVFSTIFFAIFFIWQFSCHFFWCFFLVIFSHFCSLFGHFFFYSLFDNFCFLFLMFSPLFFWYFFLFCFLFWCKIM